MQLCSLGRIVLFLGGLLRCSVAQAPVGAAPGVTAQNGTMRDRMLARFKSHFGDVEKGLFFQKRTRPLGNMSIMMSKQDKKCSGKDSPEYHIDFVVEGVRPVDVFNILADTAHQPGWLCHGCLVKLVKNDLQELVQGSVAVYRSPPVNRREFYQWQAAEANFDTEEFLVGVQARGNHILHEMMDPEPDATVARCCMAFSWIRKHPLGAHVVQMSHFNVRVPMEQGPFSERNMYHMVWPAILQRVPRIVKHAKIQRAKGWKADKITIPQLFIGKRLTSSPPADTQLTAPSSAGDVELRVENSQGFEIGAKVSIDVGTPQEETNQIANLGSIIMKYPTKFNHPSGAKIHMPGFDPNVMPRVAENMHVDGLVYFFERWQSSITLIACICFAICIVCALCRCCRQDDAGYDCCADEYETTSEEDDSAHEEE